MAKKMRADQLVFEQGLAESREQAKRLIMAGQVVIDPQRELPEGVKPEPVLKAGQNYPADTVSCFWAESALSAAEAISF